MRQSVLFVAMLALLFVGGGARAQGPVPAPPPDAASPEHDCFRNEDVAGWGLIDGRTVRVRINSNQSYALTTRMSARRLRWEMAISLSSRSGWICTGNEPGIEIRVAGATPRAWVVETVTRIPPREPE